MKLRASADRLRASDTQPSSQLGVNDPLEPFLYEFIKRC